ncbi:MAG: RNA polymerase subunit sigma-70 [Planctomycetaceae bacterium]|nr:RNA polymerase subunit sigma-70 [Planctomycetaceae bacterium]
MNSQRDDSSVTQWLDGLKAGDSEAIRSIVDRYLDRVARLVERRLPSNVRRVTDGEDVALSTLESVVRRAGEGQFGKLECRDDLWRLLVAVGLRKAARQCVRESAQKRGGGAICGEADAAGKRGGSLDYFASSQLTPDKLAEEHECADRILEFLNGLDPTLSHVAIAKCQGMSHERIADLLDVSTRTVERKLRRLEEKAIDWVERDE